MAGKFTSFVAYVILLITLLGLIDMVFNLHRFAFVGEFLILLGLFIAAMISAAGINNNSRWAWMLLKIFFIFVFADMVFINAISTVEVPYFLHLLAVAAVGFFISFFSIVKPRAKKAEGEAEKKAVEKSFRPGKYIASRAGAKFHAPKCDWAKKVKKENAVWFNTKEEAANAGYKADDCVK